MLIKIFFFVEFMIINLNLTDFEEEEEEEEKENKIFIETNII